MGSGRSDQIFKVLMGAFAGCIVVLTAIVFYELTQGSMPTLRNEGFGFVTGTRWCGDLPQCPTFGVAPEIFGSLVTSAIALVIGVPISIGAAVFLSELAPIRLRSPLSFIVEMLAAVPSVVYGLWGIFILVPFLEYYFYPGLQAYLGFLPIFQGTIYGLSILSAGIVLAIMIIPIVSSISRDAMLAVPDSQREAAYALGATKSEAVRMSVLTYARSGIFASIFLGLGRAFGETIAVTLVVGNTPRISGSLFSPGSTLASLIANEFGDALSATHVAALIEAGLVLLVVVFLTNLAARLMIRRLTRSRGAATYL